MAPSFLMPSGALLVLAVLAIIHPKTTTISISADMTFEEKKNAYQKLSREKWFILSYIFFKKKGARQNVQ
jgi:hypothetical protein